MQRNAMEIARRDGLLAEDEAFYAQQNAQTVRDARCYTARCLAAGSPRGICATSTWRRP